MVLEGEVWSEAALMVEGSKAAGVIGAWKWSSVSDAFVFDRGAARVLLGDDEYTGAPVARSVHRFNLHPDDYDAVMERFVSLTRSAGALRIEFRIQPPGLGTRWILSKGLVEKSADGSLSASGIVIETTDQHSTQPAASPDLMMRSVQSEKAADLCIALHLAAEQLGDDALLSLADLALHRIGRLLARDGSAHSGPKPSIEPRH